MTDAFFLGVYREQVYSPGKVREDAAVMDLVLSELSGGDKRLPAVQAERLDQASERPACVLSMAQSPKALEILEGWRALGTRVVNSVQSVRNCYRKALIDILSAQDLPMPPGRIVRVEEAEGLPDLSPSSRLWLKRGDVHAVAPGDVVQVASREALEKALSHFSRRGIHEILIQEHVEGETVKFYGVGPGAFFEAFPPNALASRAMASLRRTAERSAAALGLEVYGGDAIAAGGDKVLLVDLNDWPSFSPCRIGGAKGIARHILAEYDKDRVAITI